MPRRLYRLLLLVSVECCACGAGAVEPTPRVTEPDPAPTAAPEPSAEPTAPDEAPRDEAAASALGVLGALPASTAAWNAPAASAPRITVRAPELTPPALAGAAVTDAIEDQVSSFHDCYTADLYARLDGELDLRFVVHPSGRVMTATVPRGFGDHAELCLAEQVRHWTFPPLPDGGVMQVEVTIAFAPAAG